jgi:hypothetical protein
MPANQTIEDRKTQPVPRDKTMAVKNRPLTLSCRRHLVGLLATPHHENVQTTAGCFLV